ncbi:MAG: hypothetical protein OEY64_01845 [Nitrospinota bacterium]|nr:hypothetical protein [Nitrospinota bacterium]
MNQPSPGSRVGRIAKTVIAQALLVLLLVSVPTAHSANNDNERLSGVVAPKITIVEPSKSSTAPDVFEYRIPTKYSMPTGLAVDSKDRVWFTEMAGNSVGVLTPGTNEIKEYRIPSTKDLPSSEWEYNQEVKDSPIESLNVYSVGSPGNLIVGKNDIIWFVTHLGNSIVRFEPDKEEFTEFILPTEDARPYDLAEDSKGNIWFVEKNGGKLARLDFEKKKIVEIRLEQGVNLMGMVIDKDDNVWIGDVSGNYLARYNPTEKKLRRFPIGIPQAQPGNMRLDKKGYIWFCQLRAQQLGVLMPDPGIFSVVTMPGKNTVPQAIAPADDDKVWVVDSMMNRFGYFDTVKLTWSIFAIPTANSQPMSMDLDSAGDIWFTESGRDANKIARVVRSTVPENGGSSAISDMEKEENAKAGKKSGKRRLPVFLAIGLFAVVLIAGFAFSRKAKKN